MPKLSRDATVIGPDCEIANTQFGQFNKIGRGCRLLNVEFGDYSYSEQFVDLANTRIGKFSNIASFARIGPTDHPMKLATMHHFLYRSTDYWEDAEEWPEYWEQRENRVTNIGHDTWIGHGAIIKPEINVGIGAVVAAGAIVTKDVEPYTIVGGVTASVIRSRFPDKVVQKLMDLAWWDWEHDTLKARLSDFRTLSAEKFADKYS